MQRLRRSFSQIKVSIDQNSRAEKIFGYSYEEAIDRHGTGWIIPEDREQVKNNMLLGHEKPYEVTALRKDGTTFPAEIQARMFDYKGRLIRVTALRDISESKQAEETLRESEERFRMIFKNSIDGIIVADPETKKFIHVNPAICKTLDYTEEELTQMSVVDIHPKNSLEHVVSEFEAQARGEKLLAMNLPFLKKDGTIIYMDVNASMVKMGEKHSVMGVFRDITERVKAEDILKKYHDELEHKVKERTFELDNALKTIQRSEKELTQRKSTLEKL